MYIRHVKVNRVSEHQMNNFSAISWWEQATFWWDDDVVHFELDQYAELGFYSANSLKQHSADRHVAPLEHIIPIPKIKK